MKEKLKFPIFTVIWLLIVLGGCKEEEKKSSLSSAQLASYSIGGSVSGVEGIVVLIINDQDNLSVSASGKFIFPGRFAGGEKFDIRILSQPSGKICSVSNGTGMLAGVNIDDVIVICENSYAIGGVISGLLGTVMLKNMADEVLSVSTDGSFTFATMVSNESEYEIKVVHQPVGQICSVSDGTNMVSGGNVTGVKVICDVAYKIGGMILGLSGRLDLRNNGADQTTILKNGSFVFDTAVVKGNAYNVVLSALPEGHRCNVLNASGTISADVNNVEVVCKAWRAAVFIGGDDLGAASSPKIALDTKGNGFSVWQQNDGTRDGIWFNRYTLGAGWGKAMQLAVSMAGNATTPQIAIDENGNALAVWRQSDNKDNYFIWSSRYAYGSGWSKAISIGGSKKGVAEYPQIAIDAKGNALSVWQHFDETGMSIRSNRYTIDAGWGKAIRISSKSPDWFETPKIAMDGSGNALAIWIQNINTQGGVWFNRYTNGTGWGEAALVDGDNRHSTRTPQIVIDPNGSAFAVWNVLGDLRSSFYRNDLGWGKAVSLVKEEKGGEVPFRISMDVKGRILFMWSQGDGTRYTNPTHYNTWVNYYSYGTWGGAARFVSSGTTRVSASIPEIVFDANGNASAVWMNPDGVRKSIFSSRFENGAWSSSSLIEREDSGDASFPDVAIDVKGNIFVVWEQSDAVNKKIMFNHFE